MMKAKMMKSGGMAKKKGYAAGGMMDEGVMMDRMGRGMAKADMQKRAEMKKGGMAKKKMMAGGGMTKKMASGGGVTRADGAIDKGHTKGRML